MAFPTATAGAVAGQNTATTSHPQTLPSGVATGELLLLGFFSRSSTTVNTPTGWTLLVASAVATPRMVWFHKFAGTGETAPTVTTGSTTSVSRTWRFTGAHATTPPEAAAFTTTLDPPSLNPAGWDVEDTLWLVSTAWLDNVGSSDVEEVTASPTNYGNGLNARSGTSSHFDISTATRNLAAASDDPGQFTFTGTPLSPKSTLIAVRPSTVLAQATSSDGVAYLTLAGSGSGPKGAASQGVAGLDLTASATPIQATASQGVAFLDLGALLTGAKHTTSGGTAGLNLAASGWPPWEPPVYVARTVARPLQLPAPVRFIAQHARTGEFLHWDLPLADAAYEHALSGPTIITGKFKPEARTLLDDTGRPLLKGWGTWVHCEIDGRIQASGLVQPSSFEGEEWTLRAEGFTSYLHGTPYHATYSQVGVDAIDVITELWRHAQSFPDGDLGVTVPRTVTIPTKLGEAARTETAEDGTVTQVAAKPYELLPWDAKDCGQVLNDLARSTPLDYVERDAWNPDHSDVTHTLVVGYPRVGHRNTDVSFIQGQNVVAVIPLTEAPDWYASAVLGIGAGEGVKAVREALEMPDPDRLRRVFVYQNQMITFPAEMRSLIGDERGRRGVDHEFTQIVVDTRHRNARLGNYQVGDDVLVQGEIPWHGWVRLWHRIVGMSVQPYTSLATLSLKRSDRFSYRAAA